MDNAAYNGPFERITKNTIHKKEQNKFENIFSTRLGDVVLDSMSLGQVCNRLCDNGNHILPFLMRYKPHNFSRFSLFLFFVQTEDSTSKRRTNHQHAGTKQFV